MFGVENGMAVRELHDIDRVAVRIFEQPVRCAELWDYILKPEENACLLTVDSG